VSVVKGSHGVDLYCRTMAAAAPRGCLLMMHGITFHSAYFQPFAQHLVGLGYTVVTFDHPGHGAWGGGGPRVQAGRTGGRGAAAWSGGVADGGSACATPELHCTAYMPACLSGSTHGVCARRPERQHARCARLPHV